MLNHSSLKKVFLFLQAHDLAHPRERVSCPWALFCKRSVNPKFKVGLDIAACSFTAARPRSLLRSRLVAGASVRGAAMHRAPGRKPRDFSVTVVSKFLLIMTPTLSQELISIRCSMLLLISRKLILFNEPCVDSFNRRCLDVPDAFPASILLAPLPDIRHPLWWVK